MNFSIPSETGPDFTFTMEVDESGKLTSLIATAPDETVYDCKIQLTSRLDPLQIECCTPDICTHGPC